MPPISILDCFSLACFGQGSKPFRATFFADMPRPSTESPAVRAALWRENQIMLREKALEQERLDLQRARRELLKQQELLDLQRRKQSTSRRQRVRDIEALQLEHVKPRRNSKHRNSQVIYVF